jgi:hypothetical protein
MLIKVESLEYRFLPLVQSMEDDSEDMPFHYNPLHNMESIWWIGSSSVTGTSQYNHTQISRLPNTRKDFEIV